METLEITQLEGEQGLRLAGELDLISVPRLREAFANVPRSGPAALDISALTFIDSSGLHAIVEIAGAQDGSGPLIVKGASEMMLRMFKITNLTEHPGLDIR